MKKILILLFVWLPAFASAQDTYPLPKPNTRSFNEYAAQTAKLSDSLNLSNERTKYAGYISKLKKTYYANGITVTDILNTNTRLKP